MREGQMGGLADRVEHTGSGGAILVTTHEPQAGAREIAEFEEIAVVIIDHGAMTDDYGVVRQFEDGLQRLFLMEGRRRWRSGVPLRGDPDRASPALARLVLPTIAGAGGDRRTLERRPTLRDVFAASFPDFSRHFSVWKPNFRGRNSQKLTPL
jgi:hypothetical protein